MNALKLSPLFAAALALAGPALADGTRSTKDTPAPAAAPTSPFTYSFNVGATTDYIFRGYSQKAEDPALQGGIDLTYALRPTVSAYFGVWASGVNFGFNPDGSRVVGAEVDIYGGIKPVWDKATFDFGVIYYAYPGARDGGPAVGQFAEQNYVELKAGVSSNYFGTFIGLPKLTTGSTVYYSPEYQGKQGDVWTLESTASYEMPKVWVFTPTLSGTYGTQYGKSDKNGNLTGFTLGNGADSLSYWNAGITFGLEKFTFDFRYWDTDVKNDNAINGGVNGWCKGAFLQCDSHYVFTGKYTY